jgi:hypothetical protein
MMPKASRAHSDQKPSRMRAATGDSDEHRTRNESYGPDDKRELAKVGDRARLFVRAR